MAEGKVQFDLDDGQILLVETDMPDDESVTEGFNLVSNSEDEEKIVKSSKQFQDVAKGIAPVANTILESLKAMNSPQEIQLEFGVKLDFASNVLIAKASTEANFKIMLKWENKVDSGTEK